MKMKFAAAAASLVLFSGCATIVSTPRQQVKIDSNPQGATVFVATKTRDGEIVNKSSVGVTPLTVDLARKDGAVFLEKEGFEPAEVPLNRTMNPWVWGDILMTSLLSTSIDTSTGASNEYDPGEYVVDLKPVAK